MAQFDLTSKIGQYLDRHLVFPLLEFLSTKGVSFQNNLQNMPSTLQPECCLF